MLFNGPLTLAPQQGVFQGHCRCPGSTVWTDSDSACGRVPGTAHALPHWLPPAHGPDRVHWAIMVLTSNHGLQRGLALQYARSLKRHQPPH